MDKLTESDIKEAVRKSNIMQRNYVAHVRQRNMEIIPSHQVDGQWLCLLCERLDSENLVGENKDGN